MYGIILSSKLIIPNWTDLVNGDEVEEDLAEEEYLKPSAMVDNSDEVVIDLAHKVDADMRRAGHRLPRRVKGGAPEGQKLPPATQLELVETATAQRTHASRAALTPASLSGQSQREHQ